MQPLRVVGAALIRDGRVLASRRTEPPALAGQWEFAGGKVEPGEGDVEALAREIREELGLEVAVGARIGPDVPITRAGSTETPGAVLGVYLCTPADGGEPTLVDHDEHRWLSAAELGSVAWIIADLPVVEAVRAHLVAAHAVPEPTAR